MSSPSTTPRQKKKKVTPRLPRVAYMKKPDRPPPPSPPPPPPLPKRKPRRFLPACPTYSQVQEYRSNSVHVTTCGPFEVRCETETYRGHANGTDYKTFVKKGGVVLKVIHGSDCCSAWGESEVGHYDVEVVQVEGSNPPSYVIKARSVQTREVEIIPW
eukprot:PhF_6_TR11144/c0_g1_i2/m.17965